VRFTFEPIGVVRSPFKEKMEAPRQPQDAEGTIELLPGKNFEDALDGIEAWDHLWVLFVFDRAEGWRPKVLPPRSAERRGVFATRSPHRPNPIGMSVVRLLGVDGLTLRVRGLDMLDGTPVLDIKPYVPYADAHPDAKSGWLGPSDPKGAWEVTWSGEARVQADWLREHHGVDLVTPVNQVLALGPQPHAYRRIRKDSRGLRLAYKEWRVRFVTRAEREIVVQRIASGYRPKELATSEGDTIAMHRAFVERFGSE
jgi:tRNA-Thr(GGU) m(6)t(6)A37 methyltransferase TsaA